MLLSPFRVASDMVRNDRIAQLLEHRTEHDQRQVKTAVDEFRQLHQQPADRREWDLYDPDRLKKDKPARVADDDPRCTVSGLQKFDGEDLNRKARDKYQIEQGREWYECFLDDARLSIFHSLMCWNFSFLDVSFIERIIFNFLEMNVCKNSEINISLIPRKSKGERRNLAKRSICY